MLVDQAAHRGKQVAMQTVKGFGFDSGRYWLWHYYLLIAAHPLALSHRYIRNFKITTLCHKPIDALWKICYNVSVKSQEIEKQKQKRTKSLKN
jgi:hypothetical protein